ncbi:hypothetical protein BaRGS_00007425, partial [Batillaria attramentaria]
MCVGECGCDELRDKLSTLSDGPAAGRLSRSTLASDLVRAIHLITVRCVQFLVDLGSDSPENPGALEEKPGAVGVAEGKSALLRNWEFWSRDTIYQFHLRFQSVVRAGCSPGP